MKVVIDTNILLVAISSKSPYHWIFELYLQGILEFCVTTEILSEYEEIIGRHMGTRVADTVLQIIEVSHHTQLVTNYFKWNLIPLDPDDNKFVDCAIAAGAQFILTEDKHFNVLKEIDFPAVPVINIDDLTKLVRAL